jgi:pantoate--beta-alanine ligase
MSVRVAHTITEVRALVAEARSTGLSVGLVPTMGALHAGHGRLIERACAENAFVVVTIFVNPIQFNEASDYTAYPRALDDDVAFCEARGAHVVFAPSVQEMYPRPAGAFVQVEGVSEPMEGAFRPGHFRGVATVVAKLLNIVQADRAYFGEKDAQQLAVIRRMVDDLNFPVTIVEVETVREPDGLAMSSRNRRLSSAERRDALALHEALEHARSLVAAGESSPASIKARASAIFANHPAVVPEYLEIVDPAGMQPVDQITAPVRIAGAVRVGAVRLIDNVLARPPLQLDTVTSTGAFIEKPERMEEK